MNRTVTISANGEINQQTLGDFKYLKIRSASTAFQMSYDGSQWIDALLNDEFEAPDGSQRIYFRVVSGIASTVTFTYQILPFKSQDTSQTAAKTYLLCNGGGNAVLSLPIAKNGGNINWDEQGVVPVDVTKNNLIFVPGTNNGHQRKTFVIENTSIGGNSNDVIIVDENGRVFARLKPDDQPYQFETSANFYLAGRGSAVAAGRVFYSEVYYL